MSDRRPRVALVSVGLGRVRRGFERYFQDLFDVLRDEIDIRVFKSGGERSSNECIPRLLWPATHVARALPFGRFAGRSEYHRDCLAFALTMLPRLRRGDFDVLHVIDPPLAAVLSRMKRLGLFGSTLLFTEGSNMPPELYPKVDHVHHVAQAAYENGVRYGHPASHLTLVPCGLHAEKFPFSDDRAALRRKHSVRDETFVVLAVSAVKRNHKRVDHIIGEVSKLAGDVLLWIDGNPEDADVVRLADEKLGSRCRITHVPTAQIAELYRLADVKVSASLAESFGLALVEAMSSGTSVLAHDSSHFRWLLDDERCVVDMTATGALSARLAALRHEPIDRAAAKQRSDSIRRRFDWNVVKPAYVEMYRRVAQLDVATERAEAASVEAPVVTV